MNALLAYYFKCDPDEWEDEKWALMWNRLQYAMEVENQQPKNGRRKY